MISLPPGTEMFQFPGFASVFRPMTGLTTSRVAPFGYLGISACVPLPRAFRSLPRPSSPPCAQASPTCPLLLDYKTPLDKQSTRDLSTSDNLAKVSQFRFAIPRSTTYFRCQTACKKAIEFGNWMSRCATIRCGFPLRSLARRSLLTGSVKEVIQPQVPLRLPCYDFAPVTALAFGRLLSCELRHGLRALTASMA